MAIEVGQNLLHYRLVEKIGEGGMGVVWKAVDTTLDREVAIKILPSAMAQDADRLARFEREAKLLASLNHTNIGSIYGLHETEGVRFLALELVAGEDLSRRIARGSLGTEEALDIARQTAEGLEAAHRSGIVHRDLKPANVMLTPEGTVKILDFGLALMTRTGSADSDPSASPTITSLGTQAGMILGTAAYMSPEQARGQSVDDRADVWSLGVMLLEMLGGRKVFKGDSVTDTLAEVLKSEPDWEALPGTVPSSIRRLLRRCLQKNPHNRLHDVADVRILLCEALASDGDEPVSPSAEPPRRRSPWLSVVALAVAAAAIAYAAFFTSTKAPTSSPIVRLQVAAETLDFSTGALPFALSPDGNLLVYVDYDGPATRLFLRRMDSFAIEPVSGTEGAGAPFFSPDGAWIGFYAYGEIKKVALAGGRPIALSATPHAPGGATWLEDDTIVFSMEFSPTGLFRVPAGGGETEVLTTPDAAAGEFTHKEPHALPGGRSLLFTISGESGQQGAVYSMDTGKFKLLSGVQGRARYVRSGHLVYGTGGSVLAVPFDPVRGETTGPTVAVLQGVGAHQGGASFAVSAAGALAYLPPGGFDVVWVDRNGAITPLDIDEDSGGRPILSRDGKRLAVPGGTSVRDGSFHVHDLVRGGRIRLPGFSHMQWSPGDSEILTALRPRGVGDIYRLRASGSGEPELVYKSEHNAVITGMSPDGKRILFYEQHPETSRDIWTLTLDGSSEAVRLVSTPGSDRSATFSPDGRWFAYASNVSGRDEIYVRRFAPSGGASTERLISTEGGREPQWSRDGKELFYRVGRAMMAVEVEIRDEFRAGEPRKLFEGNWGVETGGMNQMYDVAPDGKRFVMVRTGEESNTINVVLAWSQELERQMATPPR